MSEYDATTFLNTNMDRNDPEPQPTAVAQAYKQGYNDAQADVFPLIERLEKKVDLIGNQLNWVVTTVTQFVEAIGKSPMAGMFGKR